MRLLKSTALTTGQWADVVGYEGLYEVSDFGQVRRIGERCNAISKEAIARMRELRSSGATLESIASRFNSHVSTVHRICQRIPASEDKPTLAIQLAKGYPFVGLCKNGKVKLVRVHTLVVTAFIGPIPEGLTVNHKDGVKTNNSLDNLEIATYKEQSAHSRDVLGWRSPGPQGESARTAKLTEADVRAIRASTLGVPALAKHYGVYRSTIRYVLIRRTWKHI